ncbi:efflux RND transporter permease subunit [Oceanibaculum indicum]|uniref:Multidrug efflux pump subunit AcrB n=1 Tax=Oceanibaculum indicum TaxID=526216 RepID=A0A420WPB0_9PROT|nr:efflux RND transporter permease subunit [Oceanibaculum indicum]RKQ72881.1 multidrug efflux pump subunit AcrB [Oceanibaculum indicum]
MFEAIIRRGTLMTVTVLVLGVLGVVAATRIPVQMIPDLDVRTISVRTDWPGATPQDIEKEILIEQEQYLRSIPSLERLVATASTGEAEIELEFAFDVDITEKLIQVNNALSQVPSYPENVDQPRIYATSFSANSFMFFNVTPLPGNPRGLNMIMMEDFLDDTVRPRMEAVTGVSRVNVYGGAERQVQILLDPARLAERDLTVLDVREALAQRNRDTSGGELESGKRRFLLRTIGRFDDLEALGDLIVVRRGDALVRLKDLGEIRLGHAKQRTESFVNGQPVVSLSVRRESGSNVIDIKRAMLETIDEVNTEVLRPAGMQMTLLSDDVRYVEASVRNVWINLGIGAVLATAVMFLFLRSGKATLVGVMGIPLCTVAAFLGLLLAGRTVNVISLAGVAFAIGMTLDNSIVVLESIDLHRRKGLDRMRAAVEGVRKVWPAVVASTLTTILVFVPILFIEEEAGQIYSDIAIAISASILASMLVAVTLVPTAAARIDFIGAAPGGKAGKDGPARKKLDERIADGVQALIATPARRLGCLAGTVGLCAFVIVGLTPAAEYLPEGEEPKTFAVMNAPPGYNLSAMSEIGRELEAYFLPFVDDDPARFAAGEVPVPAMRYINMRIEAQQIRIIAESVDPAQIDALSEAIARKYREYPGMRAFATQGSIITSNDGGTRSINLDISGPSLQAVYEVALAAYRRAGEIFENPRIQAQPATLSLSQPLIEVRPDWRRAAELGLNGQDIGFMVSALTDGAYVGEFFQDDDKIDIYFYSGEGQRVPLDGIGTLPIRTPQGAVVPLSSVARIVETVDTNIIRRLNGRRTVTLNVIPPDDVPLESGVALVRQELVQHLRDSGAVPADIRIDISGASDQLAATQEALSGNYVVAIVIVYLLLVAIFTHWGYPLLIMATIPLGIAGGIVGLWLMNVVGGWLPSVGLAEIRQPFDMISMLGFLILMGTVVNNPILIVHQAMELIRREGRGIRDAIREAVASRLRPIAMSTITTICGLAPLVLLPGEGTELYRGVGAIVLFGILGATIVTLTFLPCLMVFVLGWGERRKASAVG